MTRTRPTILALLAVLGGAGGWFLEVVQVATGRPVIVPPVTLAVVLALIGVIVVVLAVPVFRVVRGTAKKRVDPFYATRVVVLAKASSITGALLGGTGLGILGFLLSRSVVAGVGSVSVAVATTVGAVILLIGGLVAERMCTLPPDDDSPETSTATPG